MRDEVFRTIENKSAENLCVIQATQKKQDDYLMPFYKNYDTRGQTRTRCIICSHDNSFSSLLRPPKKVWDASSFPLPRFYAFARCKLITDADTILFPGDQESMNGLSVGENNSDSTLEISCVLRNQRRKRLITFEGFLLDFTKFSFG